MTDMAVVHERALRSRGEVSTARHRGGDLPGAIAASALPTRHRNATERMPEGRGAPPRAAEGAGTQGLAREAVNSAVLASLGTCY